MPTDLPRVVEVPAGRVELTDARTRRSRTVELAAYAIGRTPVTRSEHRALGSDASGTEGAAASTVGGPGDVPAHGVTWFEAIRWCNLASVAVGLEPAYEVTGREVRWDVGADGYRLPTEAEWEHACRAGAAGPAYGPLAEIAWTSGDDVPGPQPVALKSPNGLGLFDTLGNVWEWCWDYADPARYGEYRSLRGGGWADRSWSVRASVRRGSAPDARIEDVGFRVARGPVEGHDVLAAQGWSDAADRERADVRGPVPLGWTPLVLPSRGPGVRGGEG